MSQRPIRTALVGAGYIAQWHTAALRKVDNAVLTAVCDRSPEAAEPLAGQLGVAAYSSISDMVAADACDAVHILTPPITHGSLALECLDANLHVLLEKPMATTAADCAAIMERAQERRRVVGVSHNFLGLPSYIRLKKLIQSGNLGRVSSVDINWCFPLEPLRSGPFGLWMLQTPRNLLLELGPHLYAFAINLFGELDVTDIQVGKPIEIPGFGCQYQSWLILARAGDVDIRMQLSLVETMDDRSILVQGSSARARLDYAKDTLTVDRPGASDIIIGPLLNEFSAAGQRIWNGTTNAVRQLSSLNQRSPYGLGFIETASAFYQAIATAQPIDERFSARSGHKVIAAIEATCDLRREPAPTKAKTLPCDLSSSASKSVTSTLQPSVCMVIGGTGFLGRDLVRGLVQSGRCVRVVSRGGGHLFAKYGDQVETVSVSLKDRAALVAAMQGVDVVFNLARALEKTWEACLANDVSPTIRVAEAAHDAKVRRLVYTGTIASYDMSNPQSVITETTQFDDDLTQRNLYARSKAVCEQELMRLHRELGLDVVIARPGIVVGPGGPLQHWGIGRWNGSGAVRIWGHGRNTLPFVLVRDVTDGLMLMSQADAVAGQSFNLVGEPMLSARDYFAEIEKTLGAKIVVKSSWLPGMYASGSAKTLLKRTLLNQRGLSMPSLADWRSRAHFSSFDNALPKKVLGWSPESNRDTFIRDAIEEANLFGF